MSKYGSFVFISGGRQIWRLPTQESQQSFPIDSQNQFGPLTGLLFVHTPGGGDIMPIAALPLLTADHSREEMWRQVSPLSCWAVGCGESWGSLSRTTSVIGIMSALPGTHVPRSPVSGPGWFWGAGKDHQDTCAGRLCICLPQEMNMKLPYLIMSPQAATNL